MKHARTNLTNWFRQSDHLGYVRLGKVRLGNLTIFSSKESGWKREGKARSLSMIISGPGLGYQLWGRDFNCVFFWTGFEDYVTKTWIETTWKLRDRR
jgi:hypothetical protein